MIETPEDAIVRSPWGRYTCTGSAIVWCASPKLCGARVWGRPDADETRRILRLFGEYPKVTDPTFDMILDTRDVEHVDPDGLKELTGWMAEHRAAFVERMRVTCIIREGPNGFMLVGLMPAIVEGRAFRVTTDAVAAFREIAGDEGAAIADEIDAAAARLQGVPRELQLVRSLLATRLDATIDMAAKSAGTSPRSLKRLFSKHGTSFHDEVVTARMKAARELLLGTDLKVAAIGARLGISERAVTMLFRAKTGMTPIEWRTKNRADSGH